jgi:hypothetical protein
LLESNEFFGTPMVAEERWEPAEVANTARVGNSGWGFSTPVVIWYQMKL